MAIFSHAQSIHYPMPRSAAFLKRFFNHPLFISLLGAILTVLGFAPFHAWPLTLLGIALFYEATLSCLERPRMRYGVAFCFAQSFAFSGAYWLGISIHHYGGQTFGVTLGLLVLIFSFFSVFWFLCAEMIVRGPSPKRHIFPYYAAACWTFVEILRTHCFTGFPWLLLGHIHTNSPFKGLIPILGEIGLTFLTALFATLCVPSKRLPFASRLSVAYVFILALISSFFMEKISFCRSERSINITLVQGATPQDIKWDPEHLRGIMARYHDLSLPRIPKTDFIVWPEAAVPVLAEAIEPWLLDLEHHLKKHRTRLLMGIPMEKDQNHAYNSALLLGDTSREVYHKQKLLPFGDYTPFQDSLGSLMNMLHLPLGGTEPGPKTPHIFEIGSLRLGLFICFEATFQTLLRDRVLRGSTLLGVLSNNAWFDDSIAADQHLQMVRFRARQAARPFFVVSSDGVSAFIGPRGKILARAPRFKPYVLSYTVSSCSGQTPWVRTGDTPYILIITLGVLLGLMGRHHSQEERPGVS